MTRVGSASPLLGRLRATLVETFRDALRGADRVALLDFPTFANPGDSAIWLGELSVLREPGMPRLAAVADARTYRPQDVERRLGPRGAVVLTGGGNLGDLWPQRQAFRERVLHDFARRRVVQAPQSIHFEEPAALARARAAFDAHPDLVLLVRDRVSLEFARSAFRAPATLCPDAAFGLDLRPADGAPAPEILCLLRDDREGTLLPAAPLPEGVRVVDWNHEVPGVFPRFHGHLCRAAARGAALRRWLLPLTYAPVARLRLGAARRLVAGSGVVVTDRVHGHVLATLLSKPQVLLPERTGKLAALHAAWTRDVPNIRVARDLPEALELARTLLT